MSHRSGRGKKKGFGFGGFSLTSSFLPQSWGAGIMAEREKGQGMEHNKTQKRERVTIVRKYYHLGIQRMRTIFCWIKMLPSPATFELQKKFVEIFLCNL